MAKESCIIQEAVVAEVLPDNKYRVKLTSIPGDIAKKTVLDESKKGNKIILAYASGLLRRRYVKIMAGDRVKVEIPIYNLELGRITQRYRSPK